MVTPARPAWAALVDSGAEEWQWRDQRLYHRVAATHPCEPVRISGLRRLLLDHVYAAHNSARAVRTALAHLFDSLEPNEWALNLGAGRTSLHPRAINVDIFTGDDINVVTHGHELPFLPDSLALVVSQEVLEHLPDPLATIREVHRVLRPGGAFFCQIPFMIGKHHGPHDYWRFTREGVEQLFDPRSWNIQSIAPSVGHGTGFYRIAVEFVAVTASAIHRLLYLPVKAAAAVVFLPIKLADLLTPYVSEVDRIPGGYFCIAHKRAEQNHG